MTSFDLGLPEGLTPKGKEILSASSPEGRRADLPRPAP